MYKSWNPRECNETQAVTEFQEHLTCSQLSGTSDAGNEALFYFNSSELVYKAVNLNKRTARSYHLGERRNKVPNYYSVSVLSM